MALDNIHSSSNMHFQAMGSAKLIPVKFWIIQNMAPTEALKCQYRRVKCFDIYICYIACLCCHLTYHLV